MKTLEQTNDKLLKLENRYESRIKALEDKISQPVPENNASQSQIDQNTGNNIESVSDIVNEVLEWKGV